MDADTFAAQLGRCEPSVDFLRTLGITSSTSVSRIQASYRLAKREQIQENPLPDDPLCQLICSYQTKNLELGQVTVFDKIVPIDSVWVVGDVGGDDLVILRALGEVVVLEVGAEHHILYKCASSSEAFLDAMLTFACNPDRVQTSAPDLVEEYAQRAGGDRYISFYEMMVGDWRDK